MTKDKIVKLLELIEELVNDGTDTWSSDKRDAVINASDEVQEIALYKFVSWFEPEEQSK